MVDKFSKTLIGCSIILSIFLVKLSNEQTIDACEEAYKKLLLPANHGSCQSAILTYEKKDNSSKLDLNIRSNVGVVLELNNLERTKGILANSQTPVFSANKNATANGNISYPQDLFVMEDIGEFSLYQNSLIRTSCELYKDGNSEYIYGTVGLDAIFIGSGVPSSSPDEMVDTSFIGPVAVITLVGGINHLEKNNILTEGPKDVYESSGKTAYPELLIVADYTVMQNISSKVDFVRGLLLWLNAADMLFSLLQSPRIHLNIAGIIMAESYDVLPNLQKSLSATNTLRLNDVMKNVEKEFYDKSDAFPLDCYDYAIVLTGNNICSTAGTECVNGKASLKPNTVNKTMRYKDRINTAAIIDIMIALPTQMLITKKIAQLMGGTLVGEENAEECPGIMDDYTTVSTSLKWAAECSVKELTKFYNSSEAGNLWNNPQMCFAEKPLNPWDGEWNVTCKEALKKLKLHKDYVGSCMPVAMLYTRLAQDQLLYISVGLQNGSMVELAYLQRTEGILANNSLPVMIANETEEFYETKNYFRDQDVMNDIGDVKFYRNYASKTSCELYKDAVGENIYGTVGLDTIFIGVGLQRREKRHSVIVRGLAALITLTNGKNLFALNHTQTEISPEENGSSGDATAELLLIADRIQAKEQSRVELVRQIFLWMNAADMLLSPLQSPRIHLKIVQIVISEGSNELSYVNKSMTPDGKLRLVDVIQNVEHELYNKSQLLPLDTYDYAIVFTGHSICLDLSDHCVDGRVSSSPNPSDKTAHHSDRVAAAALINTETNSPTQIVITKKLSELMGAVVVGEKNAEECAGIMNEYSCIATPLIWSNCSKSEISKFFRSPEAAKLWDSGIPGDVDYPADEPESEINPPYGVLDDRLGNDPIVKSGDPSCKVVESDVSANDFTVEEVKYWRNSGEVLHPASILMYLIYTSIYIVVYMEFFSL